MSPKIILILTLILINAAGIFSQTKEAQSYYNAGVKSMQKGKYDDAVYAFTLAIDSYLTYTDAFLMRAKTYEKMELYENAINDYAKAMNMDPKDDRMLQGLAEVYYSKKDYKSALKFFTKAIHVNQGNTDALYGRGNVYYVTGDFVAATEDYKKAVDINPGNEIIVKRLVEIYLASNDNKSAIECLTKAIEVNPKNTQNYYDRANIYSAAGDYVNAAKDYSALVSMQPKNKEVKKQLETFVADKKLDLAVIMKSENISANNKNVQLSDAGKDNTTGVYEQNSVKELAVNETKSTDNSVQTDNTIQEVITENVSANTETTVSNVELKLTAADYISQGVMLFISKDYTGALAELNKAADSDPGLYEIYYHRGKVYTELGDFSSAINEYSKTIELNPNHEKAYINRGYVYNEMKEYSKAILDFREGIGINPNSSFGYYNIGVAYFNSGDRDKAVENFQNAARLGDTDTQEWLKSNGYTW